MRNKDPRPSRVYDGSFLVIAAGKQFLFFAGEQQRDHLCSRAHTRMPALARSR